MLYSIYSALIFYAFCLVGGIVGYIFLYHLFPSLKDRGYAAGKLFFILIACYLIWITSSIIPNIYTPFYITFIFSSLLIGSLLLLKKSNAPISFLAKDVNKKNRSIIVIEEVIFLIFYVIFLLIRLWNPDLWHPYMGGEKPMDVAFINSIRNGNNIPPLDPWLSGHTINYYYFGHFIVATTGNLLHIPTSFLYNIFLSFLFAKTAILSFLITSNITRTLRGGFLAILFLLCIGNLTQPFLIIKSFTEYIPINAWYWNATRIMPNFEINEFPYFSFIYADLHSHVIALPIILLLITFLIQIFLGELRKTPLVVNLLIVGMLLGIIRITNVWDFPTSVTISFIIFSLVVFQNKKPFFKSILELTVKFMIVVFISFIAIIPFLNNFRTGQLGLSLYNGPSTIIFDYLLIHGIFLFVLLFYFIVKMQYSILTVGRLKRFFLIIPFAFIAFSLINNLQFLLFLSILLFAASYSFLNPTNDKTDKFIISIGATAILLTSIPDIVEFKLGLGRMNTVFKFYYQAWLFFALFSSFAIIKTLQALNNKAFRWIYIGVIVVLTLACFSYVPTATYAKIVDRIGSDRKLTLDGEAYMQNSVYFDSGHALPLATDYKAIKWIRDNIEKNAVILEATTPIYRWGSRVSIYTGNPTVLGWDWHEIAHRQYLTADYIHSRANDIKMIYESTDQKITKELLKKYKVSYVYIGTLEKLYYDTKGIENLISSGLITAKSVYSTPEVSIYKIK